MVIRYFVKKLKTPYIAFLGSARQIRSHKTANKPILDQRSQPPPPIDQYSLRHWRNLTFAGSQGCQDYSISECYLYQRESFLNIQQDDAHKTLPLTTYNAIWGDTMIPCFSITSLKI